MQIYKSNANLRIANIRMGAFRIAEARRAKRSASSSPSLLPTEARRAKARCSHAGFTLIELLISMSIFSIVMISAVGLFDAGIKNQRKALALQTLSDNTSYAIEYMSRTIRMAKKDLATGCNFENPNGNLSKIRFLNYHNKELQEFILENGQIKGKKVSDPQFTALTSDNFQVKKLVFRVSGACQTDELQPKVTIVIEIQTKEAKPQTLKLETTISQRDLDVKY
jgi:prepilin-type N-terminal cleavage/methylation domain-containing protein